MDSQDQDLEQDDNDEENTTMIDHEDEQEDQDDDDYEQVILDDDDVPMSDDDDDDDDNASQLQLSTPTPIDMSILQWTNHTDHVYAVAITSTINTTNTGTTGIASTTTDTTSTSTTSTINPNKGWNIASGAGDDKAFLYHYNGDHSTNHDQDNSSTTPTTTTALLLPHQHVDSVACVAFHPNLSHLLAVASYDGTICIYNSNNDLSKQQQQPQYFTLEGPSDVEWITWHPVAPIVIVGSMTDGTVWMFNTTTCLQVLCGHGGGVTAGSFLGQKIVSSSLDGTVKVWAPKTGKCVHTFTTTNTNNDNDNGLLCMAVQNPLILVGAQDGVAYLCHYGPGSTNNKIVATLKHYDLLTAQALNDNDDDDNEDLPSSVEAVAFCISNPQWCATAGVDGVLKIWDLAKDGQCRHTCVQEHENTGGITRVVWHPTIPLVFAAYADGNVRLWDARNGGLLTILTGHSDVINDLAVGFCDDYSALVVTGSDDKMVRLFHVNVVKVLEEEMEATTKNMPMLPS